MQDMSDVKLTFGPVPSRQLGRSLGINNIPPKVCSYSCVYCQLGPTRSTETFEGNAFGAGDNLEEDLLSIASGHPMRADAVHELLVRSGADWTLVQRLLLVQTEYQGRRFYVRRLEQRFWGGK